MTKQSVGIIMLVVGGLGVLAGIGLAYNASMHPPAGDAGGFVTAFNSAANTIPFLIVGLIGYFLMRSAQRAQGRKE